MPVYHFYTDYEPKADDAKLRHRVARMTWATQKWVEVPVRDESLPRLWEEEGRKFPYVKDVFGFACLNKEDNDIMCYTNADICVRSNCAMIIAASLQDTDAFYSMRRDFNHDFTDPIPDSEIPSGAAYVGSDLYAFRVHWWRKVFKDFPDMIVGMEAWDAILRHLIEHTNPGKPVSVPDTHYHRRHGSYWETPQNRYRLKGQRYCLDLAKRWLRSYGINPAIHGLK